MDLEREFNSLLAVPLRMIEDVCETFPVLRIGGLSKM